MLTSWESTADQLNSVYAINAHSLLVVGVKMRPVMWRTGFGIHANNNPKKPGKFYHEEDLIRMADEIDPLFADENKENKLPLWNWWALSVLVGLVSVEWFLRKFNGLS